MHGKVIYEARAVHGLERRRGGRQGEESGFEEGKVASGGVEEGGRGRGGEEKHHSDLF